MKIVIDGIFFQTKQRSGIARVWQSLMAEWVNDGFAKNIVMLDRANTVPKIPGIRYESVPVYDYNNTDADRQMLQQLCDRENADLFVSTYYTTPVSTPSVFVAYDMIPEVTGGNLSNPMWREKHFAIDKASSYIAISQNTAKDLVKFFPQISLDAIAVARCGVPKEFYPASLSEIETFKTARGIDKPYFLIVGDRMGFNGYKNTVFFFHALARLSTKSAFDVVCTGGQPALEPNLQAHTEGIKVHLLDLNDAELKAAYSGATALIVTSKYEGFGLPILEAMACGCPVIATPNSSIPEVAGEAALYVKDNNVKSLVNALLDVQKPDVRNSLIAAGIGQSRKFSWSRMAKTVSAALIKACGDRPQTMPEIQPETPQERPQIVQQNLNTFSVIIEQYVKNSADATLLANVREVRKQVAENWLNLSDRELASNYAGDTGKLHQALLGSNIKDEPLTKQEEAFVSELSANVAQGFNQHKAINYLLAAMLYRRADRLPINFDRAALPNWFASEYLKFMFASPNLFQTAGEADNYYQFMQSWVNYIHRNIFNQPDSQLWQNISLFFSQVANFIPLYFTTANLRDIYVKRAEIIELTLKNRGSSIDCIFPARSESRTKIRLGIINDHFMPQTETFATIPVFEHLDRSRFEIFLYALNTSGHQLEQYCQSRADKLTALPKEFASQVQTIRADDLDILFFGTNLTAINKPTTSLAMHRLARIQATSFCSPTTTGSKHVDYYIAGSFAVPDTSYQEQYCEQLAVLEGSGFCFNYATESEVALVKPTRESLGLNEKTTVFISGANFYKILPELRETWVKILAAVPDSVLILYPFGPAWTRNYPTAPFVNNFNAVCAKHGINSNRLCFVKQLPSRADVKEFLRLADVYLDSYPYAGATSLIDPLQVGLPTVVVEGNALRFRQGAAMLRELGIPDLIASDEASYVQLAISLATNPQLRQQKRQEIQQKMYGNPRCFDSVAYSEAIGQLFQELFEKWQNSRQEVSRTFQETSQQQSIELSHTLASAVKIYHRNSSNTSVIAELRQLRKQIADFWLKVPAENLETNYNSDPGNNYQTLLFSSFQTQPLLEEEQIFLQQLTQISKGLVHPQAINALLAGMLYFPPGTMRIPEARNRLPHWLIEDYERVFEPENTVNSASSSELLAEYIRSQQFVNQLLGCVNLYQIDPSEGSIILELRQLRKQLADFWLTVPPDQLETAYSGEVRKAYQALLSSGLQVEKLTETEEKFLQQLTEISKGLVQPQAINGLLGAMLYFVPGKMRVPDARARLPQWLIDDYEKVFESVFAGTEKPVKENYLPQFMNQLSAAMNLYQTEPTSEKALADLRYIRKQIADLWLSVTEEQLEVLYGSDFGKAYKALLDCGFTNEPLHEDDRTFLNSLISQLSKGFDIPKATNHLLAARLYCRAGQLQVQDANTCLPPWLLEDYENLIKVAQAPQGLAIS